MTTQHMTRDEQIKAVLSAPVPERHEAPDVSELRRLDENATPGPCRRGVRPMRLADWLAHHRETAT